MEILLESIRNAKGIIDKQAEDEGLWFISESITEAYFQQELRKLHALIEDIYEKSQKHA